MLSFNPQNLYTLSQAPEVILVLDPLGKYQEMTKVELFANLGSFPDFIKATPSEGNVPSLEEQILSECFHPSKLCGKLAGGVYSYPDDPDLYPFASLILPRSVFNPFDAVLERVDIFPYEITAFTDKRGYYKVFRCN